MSISVRQAIPRLAVAASLCLSVSAPAADIDTTGFTYPQTLEWLERPHTDEVGKRLSECLKFHGPRHITPKGKELSARFCLCQVYKTEPEKPEFCGGVVHRKKM